MIAVVSDTSPVNYLCLIDAIDLLPRLFERVFIPPAVLAELRHPSAPPAVSQWLAKLPPWVTIQAPTALQTDLDLDTGETEAISLALELRLPAILIDERDGRIAAERRGLTPVGTLNILFAADRRRLLRFEKAVDALRHTNFHVSNTLVETLLRRSREEEPP